MIFLLLAHRSAEHGTDKVIDLLVKAKVDLNVADNYNDTPLKWAKASGHREMFEAVMRKNGKKVGYDSITDDFEALLNAAQEGKTMNFMTKIISSINFTSIIFSKLTNGFRKYRKSSRIY